MSEELYEEQKVAYDKIKQELNFNSTFDELEAIFFIKDDVLGTGAVSERYDRQLCSRIVDTYYSWYNKLHSILMPNPGSIVNMTENNVFSDEEKSEMNIMMNKMMAHVSKNGIIGVTQDMKGQGEFIDQSVKLWNEELKQYMEGVLKKIQSSWEKYTDPKNIEN